MSFARWAALAAFALAGTAADAAIVRVSAANFNAQAGLITFSEFGLNTVNPVYAPAQYGGGATAPTVSFGGWFLGQSLSPTPSADCPGAAASACVVGAPTGPLSLDPNAPNTFITTDGSNPTSPVLSGSPRFNGPIAVLFDVDQVAVGFDGGFFDAVGSTGITAFARDGSLIGTVTNEITGIEFLGLVSDNAQAVIAGVFLDLVGTEPAGFAIDNLRFGVRGQIILPPGVTDPGQVSQVPVPAALPLLISGLAALQFVRRRRTV
ncbi:MAG: VPLPA-CTERM sorting domain-containing protein [Rubrimonas sp.]